MDDSLYTLEFKWETSMLLGSILNTVEVFWGFKVTGEKNMEQFNMVKNCPAQNSKSTFIEKYLCESNMVIQSPFSQHLLLLSVPSSLTSTEICGEVLEKLFLFLLRWQSLRSSLLYHCFFLEITPLYPKEPQRHRPWHCRKA